MYGTSYPAFRFPAYNFWPVKFVTELYKLAKQKTSNFCLDLHTCTPVMAVSSIPGDRIDSDIRRWLLSTTRGKIRCTYVIHATNGFAGYLLPHLRGSAGIIPTRGQVMALRANTTLSTLTKASWAGNKRFNYWFPRPADEHEGNSNPIVILGGGRQASGPKCEQYEIDDSVVREDVGEYLRGLLPEWFPGKFEKARNPDMEWVRLFLSSKNLLLLIINVQQTGIMGFTKLGDPFVASILFSIIHA